MAYHQRRYRRGKLEAKFRRNGFEVLFPTSFTSVLLPLTIVSRFKEKGRGKGKDSNEEIEREFTVDPRINGLLTAILRAEIRMTLAGWRRPAGGSRVVVARRYSPNQIAHGSGLIHDPDRRNNAQCRFAGPSLMRICKQCNRAASCRERDPNFLPKRPSTSHLLV